MSGKVKKLRKQIQSKIEVIKKINDDPKKSSDDIYDLYLDAKVDDLSKKFSSKKDALLGKFSKKKKDNQEDGTYKKETKGICRETSKGEKQKWQASG